MTPLKPLQRQMLTNLVDAGHGVLDASGNVRTEPYGTAINGNAVTWLTLVAAGYVAGERGLILPTEEGREAVVGLGNGRVRESR